MKILIFYASYGGGHLNAAKSIHEFLKNHYKELDVELIDCMKYVNKTIEKMTTKAYNEMAKKAPWAWGRIYSDAQKGPLAHIKRETTRFNCFYTSFRKSNVQLLKKKEKNICKNCHNHDRFCTT